MKATISIPIDPLRLSFKELKISVAKTSGKKIPGVEFLLDDAEEILFSYDAGDISITVYRNGFFLFQNGWATIVEGVDRCRRVQYRDSEGILRVITESEFSAGPCLVPLLMICDIKMERRQEDYDFYWQEFQEGRKSEA